MTSLDSTSPFLEFCTITTRGTILSLLRLVAHSYNLTAPEAIHAYFDGVNEEQKTVGFKQFLNNYFQDCCDEYLITRQQIVEGKKQFSELKEENLDEYVYCILQKIMLQNNGFKHMNCLFDGAMAMCVLQFKYVFNSLSNNQLQIGLSAAIPKGIFPEVVANLLRHVVGQRLDEANKKLDELRLNNEPYKNIRLTCNENNECGLDVFNEKQRQKQLREAINLEGQAFQSTCPHHH